MDKPIDWRGSSLEDLREFPETARKLAGQELRKVQRGEPADDWRPFPELGPGVNEIRINCADGWFRVMYVAKFEEALTCCMVSRRRAEKPPRATSGLQGPAIGQLLARERHQNDD